MYSAYHSGYAPYTKRSCQVKIEDMNTNYYKDWGQIADTFDIIRSISYNKKPLTANEAQTRFDIIDRIIREVLQWQRGQIQVEEHNQGEKSGYVDYILRS